MFQLAAAALFQDVGSVRIEGGHVDVAAHAVVGGRIVRALHGLDLEPGVRHHHERYDGTGFPDGLRGDQIPFDAQIVLAADTFDHMSHPRAGEAPLTAEDAVQEMVKGSGRQYAPDVIEIVCTDARGLYRAGESLPEEPADFARAS
jgi:HD-GYP domain-containing protein (c-di-GMP phosphodiesterase class II)